MPDYFTTYELVQQLGNIPLVPEAKINIHFPMAKLDVLNVIGADNYTAIFGATNPYSSEDTDKLALAESYLVLKYLIPAMNTETTGAGVTKATGFGDSRKENLSEYDLEKMIQRYNDNAMKILNQYAKSVDKDEDGNEDILKVQGISMACISGEEGA
jgi:hypothetical protein